ncbi:catechol 2,3-dioxygenase-like lactoylglutathione lyase family enzyme [Amycolatopsis bartoniae]|uniref:VOC domain-containing protein n=1 Tax=Amycolatopsis bartoniae TaxID=941986 RepID=A0A8H9IZ24_9PSEU|nr:hypothetical protein [Amycolatopsis bartoniae]MBB2933757.1 catechol 2,3-dioxygenase-like lactoylglutathione lyase family enzyme [Amycolatopsis bartoniae]TVT10578.1 hypothetical protein FNH07_04945 [Amycolatopsis bartoniae]GHF71922.1 hypothetical protein GCM10017566_52060 [Amycolatopsis bartoniae]
MATKFNHTIIASKDRQRSAAFYRDLFDRAYARLREQGIEHWADPHRQRPGETNTEHGGRGVYFLDPAGHGLEMITRPYL